MKKKISLLLIISILMISISPCRVNAEIVDNIQKAKEARDQVIDFMTSSPSSVTPEVVDGLLKSLALPAGMIVAGHVFAAGQFNDFLSDILGSNNGDEDDAQEAAHLIIDNITISDNQININPTGKQILRDYSNYIENTNKYYTAYSLNIQYYDMDNNRKQELMNLCRQYQDDYYIINVFWGNSVTSTDKQTIKFIKKGNIGAILTGNYNTFNPYQVVLRNNTTFTHDITGSGSFYKYSTGSSTNYTTSDLNSTSPTVGTVSTVYNYKVMPQNYTYRVSDYNPFNGINNVTWITYGKVDSMLVYGNDDLFMNAQRGLKNYYYNNSVWQNMNTGGNTNITTSNENNITYGDVVNYGDEYYDDHSYYPTTENINNWITTNNNPTQTPNPDNPGGGGSGSGGGSSGSIFEWLTRIGDLIGDLISGVGGFIAGLLEGVVNALTSILNTITSIITTITSSIPDNFNNLMTTILGWLPEEWTAVISAFLLVSLLVGLFKLFRG